MVSAVQPVLGRYGAERDVHDAHARVLAFVRSSSHSRDVYAPRLWWVAGMAALKGSRVRADYSKQSHRVRRMIRVIGQAAAVKQVLRVLEVIACRSVVMLLL